MDTKHVPPTTAPTKATTPLKLHAIDGWNPIKDQNTKLTLAATGELLYEVKCEGGMGGATVELLRCGPNGQYHSIGTARLNTEAGGDEIYFALRSTEAVGNGDVNLGQKNGVLEDTRHADHLVAQKQGTRAKYWSFVTAKRTPAYLVFCPHRSKLQLQVSDAQDPACIIKYEAPWITLRKSGTYEISGMDLNLDRNELERMLLVIAACVQREEVQRVARKRGGTTALAAANNSSI